MSQAEQHELPSEEGGGRLNWLLAVLVLIVAIVMGIVLAAGVQSSGVSSQSSASSDPGDASETANKGEVADLLSHGGKVPDAAPALPLSPLPAKLPVVMTQQPPHNPSPYEQWAEQKYMKALESPQIVTAFIAPRAHFPRIPSGFRTVSARCARCRAALTAPPHQARGFTLPSAQPENTA